jgi:hypothetical protein
MKARTDALREFRSVEGEHHNAGGGDPEREKCAGEEKSRCTLKEVPYIREISVGGTHCLSGSGRATSKCWGILEQGNFGVQHSKQG